MRKLPQIFCDKTMFLLAPLLNLEDDTEQEYVRVLSL